MSIAIKSKYVRSLESVLESAQDVLQHYETVENESGPLQDLASAVAEATEEKRKLEARATEIAVKIAYVTTTPHQRDSGKVRRVALPT